MLIPNINNNVSKDLNTALCGCGPAQIINFTYAFNFEDIDKIVIYNKEGCEYDKSLLQYGYSVDNVCWSCYMSFNDVQNNTIGINSDFYIRIKVNGFISKIEFNSEQINWYTTSLYASFELTSCVGNENTNLYNPYANLDCAMTLYQNLTEAISCTIGIPIYYFKLSPNAGSKDITFKEYTLMDVEAVKQIKLIIQDGEMPSSKPEFSEWGLDWQTDWETEISKLTFATAFGNNAQPMEGDIIYIPMMKRMWMVNGAYEEKKDAFMWNATTFKVTLVKYQEKESVNLGDTEELINTFVKNKYEDLFGDNEYENRDAQSNAVDAPIYAANNLYNVYESDATRKYMTCDSISYKEESLYFKSTLISDLQYNFNINKDTLVVYQSQYCGNSGVISCILTLGPMVTLLNDIDKTILECGNNIKLNICQSKTNTYIYVPCIDKLKLTLESQATYFIFLRWSQELNTIELSAAKYVYKEGIPLYKLQPFHHYFDIDNINTVVSKYDIEFVQTEKHDVVNYGLHGNMTNIKVYNIYIDNISEILQMYPTSQHLIINDTARKILELNGYVLK